MNRAGAVYGQGLYALAKQEHLEDTVLQQLRVLQGCFAEEPEYLKLLSSHDLPKQERTEILEQAFRGRVHLYVLNFLKLLTEKGYIRYFSDACKAYTEEYNEDAGIVTVRAVSAIALTEEQKLRLTDKLTAITGKKIDLVCRENPAVLGGIRLNFDGKQVDGTVQSRLAAMEKQLKDTVL